MYVSSDVKSKFRTEITTSVSHWIIIDRGPGTGRRRFGIESVASSEDDFNVASDGGGVPAGRAPTLSEAADLAEELRICAEITES